MTSREHIESERENRDRIEFYREGMFWKAYERSAFAACSQVRPFKATKKRLKVLGGEEIVSIGFPSGSAGTILRGFEILSESATHLSVRAREPIDEAAFARWKESIGVPAAAEAAAVSGDGDCLEGIISMLRGFDLSGATPLDCMNFIATLKRMARRGRDGVV